MIDRDFKQSLQPGPDHIKGKIKYKHHNTCKAGNRSVFSGQDPVDFFTADPLFAFFWFRDCLLTEALNKIKPHICDGCASVDASFCLHLTDDMFKHLGLILVQFQLGQNQRVALYGFCCCKTHRNLCHLGMIFDQVDHGMNATMY